MASEMEIKLDHTHAESMNLAVLQRLDPHIHGITASASHVAMYIYSEEKGEWVKRGIEGAIFIVERSEQPTYRMVVMNRAGRNNLVQSITLDVDFQVKKPYLLFRDKKHPENGVHGAWFHDDNDRRNIATTLNQILVGMKEAAGHARAEPAAAAPAPSAPSRGAPLDSAAEAGKALLSMLQPAPPAAAAPPPAAPVAPAAVTKPAPVSRPAAAALYEAPTPAAPPVAAAALSTPSSASSSASSLNALLGISSAAAATAAAVARPAAAAAGPSSVAGAAAAAHGGGAVGPVAAAATAAGAALLGGGMVSVLTKKQFAVALKGVLLDMLSDDGFVRELHLRYLETAMKEV